MAVIRVQKLVCLLFISFLFSCSNDHSNSNKHDTNDSLKIKREPDAETKRKAALLKFYFEIKEKVGFNGNVLIATAGNVIYRDSFGYVDIKKKIPLTTNTLFQLASTSKPFTAVAIMILKEKGYLNYSDNIKRFIPDFPYDKVTIKDLLTQRSGLPNYMYFTDSLYQQKEVDLTNEKLVSLFVDYKPPLYSPPNKKFEYCNTNFALLASIIENVSGKTYSQFMHEEIFSKLGMENTFVKDDPELKNKDVALGHHATGQEYEMDYLDGPLGDKNIYSTIDDMLKWDQALYDTTLLSKATLDEAFKGYSNEHAGIRNYGYGFRLLTDRKKNTVVVYHHGWWHGFNNVFFRRLSDKTTIIILSNKRAAGIFNSTYDILNLLDGTSGAGTEKESDSGE